MTSETPSPGRFPAALRSSAVARWSHRDPVEGGNPFPLDDYRHEAWDAATCSARDVLVRIDRELGEAEVAGPHPDPYPVRLVALAVSRFDVWARRVQSIVRSPAALRDYEVAHDVCRALARLCSGYMPHGRGRPRLTRAALVACAALGRRGEPRSPSCGRTESHGLRPAAHPAGHLMGWTQCGTSRAPVSLRFSSLQAAVVVLPRWRVVSWRRERDPVSRTSFTNL
jgi:hypothetical protein